MNSRPLYSIPVLITWATLSSSNPLFTDDPLNLHPFVSSADIIFYDDTNLSPPPPWDHNNPPPISTNSEADPFIFPAADYHDIFRLGAEPETLDQDLNLDSFALPLQSGCEATVYEAEGEFVIEDDDLLLLWARDEGICRLPTAAEQDVPEPERSSSDLPSDSLFQDLEAWFPILPKKPTTTTTAGEGPEEWEPIRLPPQVFDGEEPCFPPHPLHCCCEGKRGVGGRTSGGLMRVAVIEDCNIGKFFSFSFFFFLFLSFSFFFFLFFVVFLLFFFYCATSWFS
jgi:hypothetical protein